LDDALARHVRAECCHVLGVCNYIAVDDLEVCICFAIHSPVRLSLQTLQQSLNCLRTVWMSVKAGNADVEQCEMFAAAATAYALMLCQMPARLKEQAIIT
jgi:hypothetical protein